MKAVGKKMIQLKLMEEFDVDMVLKWNDGDKDFLKQWSNFTHPLTERQIIDRIDSHKFCVYIILYHNKPIGIMQLYRFNNEDNSAMAGCFLIDPKYRGMGFGTQALRALIDIAFNKKGLDTLGLSVYDFNKGAQKCYEKCGFVKTGESIRPNGWIVYDMEIRKNSCFN